MVNGDGYGKRNDGHSTGTSNGTVTGMVYGKPYIVLAMAAVIFVAMVVFNRRHPTPSPHLTGLTRLLETGSGLAAIDGSEDCRIRLDEIAGADCKKRTYIFLRLHSRITFFTRRANIW